MPRWMQYLLAVCLALFIAGAPFVYSKFEHGRLRNFHVVREGVLYRSGQLSSDGLKRVVYDYRIRSVVTLRSAKQPGEQAPDIDDENYCLKQGINFYRLPQLPWEGPDGSVPNHVNVVKFREIMDDPANYPVLVHCLAGKHRTGTMCAVFRMEKDHWSNEQAIDELRDYGFDKLDETRDVLGYLEAYRPTWLTQPSVTSSAIR